MAPNVTVPHEQLAAFCRQHHIRKLSLFGSILRDDFGPDSDIDVLVEFEPGRVPGLEFFAIQDELSNMLGRAVDLHTPQFLSQYFRESVQSEAEVQYAAG
jgi:predicted nucleotidyltransferase